MNRTEHLLACLAEECAEVQHAVAKALRFGLDDGYPGAASTNAQDIAREFIDVLAVMEMLEESGAIERLLDPQAIDRKKDRVLDQRTARLIDLAREPLQAKIDALMQAIRQTLDDNGHLADGENCTLIALKRALREIGVPWKGDESPNARETLARAAPAAAEKAKG